MGGMKRNLRRKGEKLARMCWKKLKEKDRVGKVESRWEKEIKRFFKERRVELKEVERRGGKDWRSGEKG